MDGDIPSKLSINRTEIPEENRRNYKVIDDKKKNRHVSNGKNPALIVSDCNHIIPQHARGCGTGRKEKNEVSNKKTERDTGKIRESQTGNPGSMAEDKSCRNI